MLSCCKFNPFLLVLNKFLLQKELLKIPDYQIVMADI